MNEIQIEKIEIEKSSVNEVVFGKTICVFPKTDK